ncbi:MAG: methyltransferase domain-containing protein [Chloroflexota bacterium]
METIRGKTSIDLDFNGLNKRLAGHSRLILDLGTGDGRYVHDLAERNPNWFVIGVDSCRENLHEHSRAKLPNAIFVIASAQNLPYELYGLVSLITINFPWGSLLDSLLTGDPGLLRGLSSISCPNAQMEIRLNGGALAEAGTNLDTGAKLIYENMNQYGWKLKNPCPMDRYILRNFPTTWARRLAYGRDPRVISLSGRLPN